MSAMVSTSVARSASTALPSATRREEYEETWTRRERERLERGREGRRQGEGWSRNARAADVGRPCRAIRRDTHSHAQVRLEAYFMDFKFEPEITTSPAANYSRGIRFCASVNYPKRMFNDSEEGQDKDKDKAGADAKNDGDRQRNRERRDRERNRELQIPAESRATGPRAESRA